MESIRWSYKDKVKDFLRPGARVLDMGHGSEEMLLCLLEPTSGLERVTEPVGSWEQRLAAMGETVYRGEPGKLGKPMPFEDASFDLVLNHHEGYELAEVARLLKKSGFFITQQVGGKDSQRPGAPDFNLENELPKFKRAGFRIMYRSQSYYKTEGDIITHRFIIIGKKT